MTVKEFLQQYQVANNEISEKLDQIWRLRELAVKTTQALSPNRVKSSALPDQTAMIVAKIVDMESEIDQDIDVLIDAKRQVESAIAALPDPRLRSVLARRYLNGEKWEQIAASLNFDCRWVTRLHNKALHELERVLSPSGSALL